MFQPRGEYTDYLDHSDGYVLHLGEGYRILRREPCITVPEPGTRLMVSELDLMVQEDDLLLMFRVFAPIYEIYIPVDWEQRNYGVAYITFFHKADADWVLLYFDWLQYELRRYSIIFTSQLILN